ncbi:hypothetical protein [Halobellus sp. Atlit-38R]|uniref:hypothetical protein n=1 Tax=Halobellus sp. Atlit-38R TaxID=2282131 RepID=UPI0011C3E292|nr:hypothetical protein [Halobellus sp. Atlit-38R]
MRKTQHSDGGTRRTDEMNKRNTYQNKPASDSRLKNISRRSVLAGIAGSSLSIGAIGSANAKEKGDFDEHMRRARNLRKAVSQYQDIKGKTERKEFKHQVKNEFKSYLSKSPEKAYRQYIADGGFGSSYRSGNHKFTPNQEQNNEVGTEAYQSSMFNWTLTLSYDCDDYTRTWADLYFYFDDLCETYEPAADPNDVVGLYFPSTDYSRVDGSEYSTDHCYVGGTDGDLDPNGIAWEYDDWAALQDESGTCPSPDASVGMKLIQNDPDESATTRLVAMDYKHTAGNCGISSISVGTGGVSIGFSCGDPLEWSITDDQGEDGVIGCTG